jgi:hypothetical protein
MNLVKSLTLVPLMAVALSSSAFAQDGAAQPPTKRYFTANGGAAVNINFEHPAATVGAEYGERIHRDVYAYAMLNYVDNVMSDRARNNLVLAGDALTAVTGVPWEFNGRDRGLAFTMGGKFMMPANMRVRPYVGAGFGIVNLKRRINERDLGDVTDEFYDLTLLTDGVIDAGSTSITKPMAEVLLGIGGAMGRTYLDVAYRYRRGFHSFDEIEFSQLTMGVGVAWP